MKKIKVLIFIAAIIVGVLLAKTFGAALGLSLSWGVRGSGRSAAEQRVLAEFKKIDVGDAFDIEVSSGQPLEVTVQTDDNLLPYIATDIAGDELKIYWKKSASPSFRPRIRITVPELTGLDVSGASEVAADNIRTDQLKLDVSGAAKVDLKGEAGFLNIDASGASRIQAKNLRAVSADLDVSGASSVIVNVTNDVRADASGAAKIYYCGEPKNLTKHISGAGKVIQK